MCEYSTDPTTLRAEAGDIDIGALDGRGYAGWLRACANKIEELEALLDENPLPVSSDYWVDRQP